MNNSQFYLSVRVAERLSTWEEAADGKSPTACQQTARDIAAEVIHESDIEETRSHIVAIAKAGHDLYLQKKE